VKPPRLWRDLAELTPLDFVQKTHKIKAGGANSPLLFRFVSLRSNKTKQNGRGSFEWDFL